MVRKCRIHTWGHTPPFIHFTALNNKGIQYTTCAVKGWGYYD